MAGRSLHGILSLIRGLLLVIWGRLVRDENALLAGVRYRLIGSLERGQAESDHWVSRPSGPRHRPLAI